jgi:hypothetical protein
MRRGSPLGSPDLFLECRCVAEQFLTRAYGPLRNSWRSTLWLRPGYGSAGFQTTT